MSICYNGYVDATTTSRDEDPVGSGDFMPAEFGSDTFFIGSGSYL